MTTTAIPVIIGSDTVGTWWAVFDPDQATQAEQAASEVMGPPAGYWMPVIGYPGQWRWPDGSVSNSPTLVELIQRGPSGTLRSRDGGQTWTTDAVQTAPESSSGGGWGLFVGVALVAMAIGLWSANAGRR